MSAGRVRPGEPVGFHGVAALIELIRDDRRAQGRSFVRWARPGLHAVIVYRFGRWVRTLPYVARIPFVVVHALMYWFVRMIYQIELPVQAEIGRGLVIAHQGGVVVSHYAKIGDYCLLRHNVTIGGRLTARDAPTLGNAVSVAPGAAIIGAVTIGDGAKIGPNAVVMTDVPPGATVLAPPSHVVMPAPSPPAS